MAHRVIEKPIPGLRELVFSRFPMALAFDDVARSQIDLFPFLFGGIRRHATLQSSPAAIGGFNIHTVPAGELWLLLRVAAETDDLDADQIVEVANNFTVENLTQFLSPKDKHDAVADGVGRAFVSHAFDIPLLLFPGDSVNTWVNQITVGAAGSITLRTKVLYGLLS